MLKKLSRFFIVAAIQLLFLVFVLFLMAPYLLDLMHGVSGMGKTLGNTRVFSFLLRLMAYAALFFAWPYITKKLIQHPSRELLQQVNTARWVFMGALSAIELLYWVGQ